MEYKTYKPSPELARYIKCYWTLDGATEPNLDRRERIFPDGCIELIFQCGDLFREIKESGDLGLQPRSFVYGQLDRFIEVESTGKIGMLGIRFLPTGLKPFVPFDIDVITGQTVPLADVWGADGVELEDRVLSAVTDNSRILIIESFLKKRLGKKRDADPIIEKVINSIVCDEGNIAIGELARQLNVGRRHLERKFVSTVGLTPKLLSRIVRFNNTLGLLERKQLSSLTMVAYEGGFYDQAHFIKDFKVFTGLNPKQYFSEDLDLVRFFNSD